MSEHLKFTNPQDEQSEQVPAHLRPEETKPEPKPSPVFDTLEPKKFKSHHEAQLAIEGAAKIIPMEIDLKLNIAKSLSKIRLDPRPILGLEDPENIEKDRWGSSEALQAISILADAGIDIEPYLTLADRTHVYGAEYPKRISPGLHLMARYGTLLCKAGRLDKAQELFDDTKELRSKIVAPSATDMLEPVSVFQVIRQRSTVFGGYRPVSQALRLAEFCAAIGKRDEGQAILRFMQRAYTGLTMAEPDETTWEEFRSLVEYGVWNTAFIRHSHKMLLEKTNRVTADELITLGRTTWANAYSHELMPGLIPDTLNRLNQRKADIYHQGLYPADQALLDYLAVETVLTQQDWASARSRISHMNVFRRHPAYIAMARASYAAGLWRNEDHGRQLPVAVPTPPEKIDRDIKGKPIPTDELGNKSA